MTPLDVQIAIRLPVNVPNSTNTMNFKVITYILSRNLPNNPTNIRTVILY